MSHFLLLYYIGVAIVGFIALAIVVFGIIRSRIATYWLLFLFYTAHTLLICTFFVREYLYTNISGYSNDAVYLTYVINTIFSVAVLAAATLYFHRLFSVRYRRIRDIACGIGYVLTAGAYVLPGAVAVDAQRGVLIFGVSAIVGESIYLALFAYMLVLGIVASKRDRSLREGVLIWTLMVFGAAGFVESLSGALRFASAREIVLSSVSEGFSISTVPYAAVGIVLIYYFGSYLLAESRSEPPGCEMLVERYGISPREREVIRLMNQGFSNREIAEKLFVSVATVKTHAHNIFEKTDTRSRYELFHLTRNERAGTEGRPS